MDEKRNMKAKRRQKTSRKVMLRSHRTKLRKNNSILNKAEAFIVPTYCLGGKEEEAKDTRKIERYNENV